MWMPTICWNTFAAMLRPSYSLLRFYSTINVDEYDVDVNVVGYNVYNKYDERNIVCKYQ